MTDYLSEELAIQQVHLYVNDLDKLIDFYTKILGLRLLEHNEQTAYLGIQNALIPAIVLEKTTTVKQRQTTGLYHTAFLLPTRKDLGNMLLWLLKNQLELGAADHGYSEALYLQDPEGNGVEIYWDKPKEEWDIRPNGEIIGVTEELDGEAVVAAADGQWLGMTSGSKIGHIHLNVADLVETAAFYQKLGFSLKANFGQQAKFFAAGEYHHHIGTNTWSGSHLPKREKQQPGLSSYTFQLSSQPTLEQLKMRLQREQIVYEELSDHLRLHDPNGMDVIFTTKN